MSVCALVFILSDCAQGRDSFLSRKEAGNEESPTSWPHTQDLASGTDCCRQDEKCWHSASFMKKGAEGRGSSTFLLQQFPGMSALRGQDSGKGEEALLKCHRLLLKFHNFFLLNWYFFISCLSLGSFPGTIHSLFLYFLQVLKGSWLAEIHNRLWQALICFCCYGFDFPRMV